MNKLTRVVIVFSVLIIWSCTKSTVIDPISQTNKDSYTFFAAPSSNGGAANDFISFSQKTNNYTFRYNGKSEDFKTYISRRIQQKDRITKYTHDVCMDKDLITYKETWKNGQSQSSNSIYLYLIHPISMGTVKQINAGGVYLADYPATSNDQGEFIYNGTQYRMFRIMGGQTDGTTWLFKIILCD